MFFQVVMGKRTKRIALPKVKAKITKFKLRRLKLQFTNCIFKPKKRKEKKKKVNEYHDKVGLDLPIKIQNLLSLTSKVKTKICSATDGNLLKAWKKIGVITLCIMLAKN